MIYLFWLIVLTAFFYWLLGSGVLKFYPFRIVEKWEGTPEKRK